jgi:cytochrome c oxidase subunit IV
MERDDLIVNDSYSLNATHDEEHGKLVRKTILKVTVLLTLITAVEVLMGVYIKQSSDAWIYVKWAFIIMTLVKAGYIVLVFMHLGEERKSLKYTILVPYAIFVAYLIFVALYEGSALGNVWAIFGT